MAEKNWYTWNITTRMWAIVRPFIKILQDEAFGTDRFEYNISECGSRRVLAMWLTHTEYIKMDIALRRVGDELDAMEYELKDRVFDV